MKKARIPANKKWFPESIIAEAKKYKTITEWMNHSMGSYLASKRTGIHERASKHMRKLHRSWHEKSIVADAQQFRTRGEWKARSHGGYVAAQRLGLMEKATAHMPPIRERWTSESVMKAAKKYSTLIAWKKGSAGSLSAALRFGIYQTASAHMKRKVRRWSDEEIIADAKKYKSRSEWGKNSIAYTLAANRGLLENACAHMRRLGNRYHRKIYAIENDDRSVYVGLSHDPQYRYTQHTSAKSNQRIDKLLRQHFLKGTQRLKVFEEMHSREQAGIAEGRLVEKYRKAGWIVLNTAKPGALGGANQIYTLAVCIELAKSCSTRTEFYEKHPSAYGAVCKNRWAGKVFANISSLVPEKYTRKAVTEAALNCSTRSEFIERFNRHYNAASRMGILSKITRHMGRGKTHSIKDKQISSAAKKCKTVMEFKSKFPVEYGAARRRGIAYFNEVAGHLQKQRARITREGAMAAMIRCRSRAEFTKKHSAQYHFMLENFPDELDKALPRTVHGKWTLKDCIADARNWGTEKEWRENSSGAYTAARKNGWLNKACAHMKQVKRRNGLLTLEFCKQDALRFETRGEWRTASPSVYQKAWQNDWIEVCCAHMKVFRQR